MPDRPRRLSTPAGTRGRIIDLLRRSPLTATELAARLKLTYNAVRTHLATLQRDGLVRAAGMQRGGTRPSALYELAPGVFEALSHAYIPFASHLVRVLDERLPARELDEIMRAVGRRLAGEWPRPRGTLRHRVEMAAALLDELGAPNEVESEGGMLRIRGFGCVLTAAIQGRPEVCRAMESLFQELLEVPVRECCERGGWPKCCFEVAASG